MKKSIIKLMPIGGQAENGKSMYCLEIDDNWFIIDAGYRFPEVDKLGVDVIIPNFDYLKYRIVCIKICCPLFYLLKKFA